MGILETGYVTPFLRGWLDARVSIVHTSPFLRINQYGDYSTPRPSFFLSVGLITYSIERRECCRVPAFGGSNHIVCYLYLRLWDVSYFIIVNLVGSISSYWALPRGM